MLIPVWRGEFGLMIRYWVPQVHAKCTREQCIVEIEPGNEALFPLASSYIEVQRERDHVRRGKMGRPPALPGVTPQWFVAEPHIRQGVDPARVVICPRRMNYGTSKNWDGWELLAETIPGVFAAGSPDGSYDVDCARAWDYPRFLDASIEAMRGADLVVATDTGLAHLAVLCGADVLLVTYQGRPAPGPVIDSSGRVARKHYWPVRLKRYYLEPAVHTGARVTTMDAWDRPEDVAQAVMNTIHSARG